MRNFIVEGNGVLVSRVVRDRRQSAYGVDRATDGVRASAAPTTRPFNPLVPHVGQPTCPGFGVLKRLRSPTEALASPNLTLLDGPDRRVRHSIAALLAANKPGLGPDTTYIHCSTLLDEELDLIAKTGGTVSLAVPIEMQMGHGMPPIQKFLDRGVRPSLSVDVETNQPSDMFTQMHACFALQRALYIEAHPNDCFFGFFEDPVNCRKVLNVRDVLEFVIVEGAKANGLENKVGKLKKGMQADVILLRDKRINVAPVNDVIGSIVLGMDRSNVDSVFIAGNPVKRNGRLVGVDVDKIMRQAEIARVNLLAR